MDRKGKKTQICFLLLQIVPSIFWVLRERKIQWASQFYQFLLGFWVCRYIFGSQRQNLFLERNLEPVFKKFQFLTLTTNQLMVAAWNMYRKGFWVWSYQKKYQHLLWLWEVAWQHTGHASDSLHYLQGILHFRIWEILLKCEVLSSIHRI